MANAKAISNQQIISALLEHGTINKAASAVGVSPPTIYPRMQEREFKGEYAQTKTDIRRQAVFSFNERLAEAIEVVADIMTDKEIAPCTRLQAAQTIIKNADVFSERLYVDERRAASECADPLDIWNCL